MKNADNKNMPAMPIELNGFGQYKPEVFMGLTKREMFAMHAMQGELAGSSGHSRPEPEDLASFAVKCADALLAELDK